MKKIVALTLAAGLTLGTASIAQAHDGCGRGASRGPHGHCHPDGGYGPGGYGGPGVVVAPGGLIIGRHYDGGYWDGHRYWHNRRWHHNNWEYY